MQKIVDNFDSLTEEVMTKYAGQWIAIVNAKVIANGKSFKEVHKKAVSKYPKEKPLYGKLPEATFTAFALN
ncbi:MAG: DUF5678 domain-containing protein [Nanoarchaeota archaeon]